MALYLFAGNHNFFDTYMFRVYVQNEYLEWTGSHHFFVTYYVSCQLEEPYEKR